MQYRASYITSDNVLSDQSPYASMSHEECIILLQQRDAQIEKMQSQMNQRKWRDSWEANKEFSPVEKAVGFDLLKYYNRAKVYRNLDTDEMASLYIPKIAQNVSIGENAAARALRLLEASGAIVLDSWEEKASGYKQPKKTHITFKPTDAFQEDPGSLISAKVNKPGGKRVKNIVCPDCGCEATEVHTVAKCPGCGRVHKEKTRYIEPTPEEGHELPSTIVIIPSKHALHNEEPLEDVIEEEQTEVIEEMEPLQFPMDKIKRCEHAEEFHYTKLGGAPGCRICDAPWSKS